MVFTRGAIVVLEILMVVPVAKLYCSTRLRISIMDCFIITKILVSSAYCDNLVFCFWFGMMKTDYFPVYNVEQKRRRTPLCYSSSKEKGVERKPLLEIIDSAF